MHFPVDRPRGHTSGPLKFNIEAGGSALNPLDPLWWGSVAIPLCASEPVTITNVNVTWTGGILNQEEWLYASPPGRKAYRKCPRLGGGPGKPPVLDDFLDMTGWATPAAGTDMAAIPCDANEAAGRFADLIVSGQTDSRGAKVERVTVTYETADGEEHTGSTSTWEIILCGDDMRRDSSNECD